MFRNHRSEVRKVRLPDRRTVVFGSDLMEPASGKRWLWAIIIACGIIVLGALYLFFLTPYFYVTDPVIIASPHISVEQVRKLTTPVLNQHIGHLIPANHRYFLNEAALKEAIASQIPLVQRVELEKAFPNVLRITIVEKEPVAVWSQQETLYLLDAAGTVLSSTSAEDTPQELPRIANSIAADQPTVGAWVIEERNLQFAQGITERFATVVGVPVVSFEIPTGFATEISAVTSEGWRVLFNTENDLDQQLTILQSILTNQVKEKRPTLRYVDLRINNLGFFK